MMNAGELYDFIINVNNKEDLIITFNDGDRYRVSDLSFYAYGGFDGEPVYGNIRVQFKSCLNYSSKFREALRLGNGNGRLANVDWPCEENEPLGVIYEPDDIITIFNENKQYFIYQNKKR